MEGHFCETLRVWKFILAPYFIAKLVNRMEIVFL